MSPFNNLFHPGIDCDINNFLGYAEYLITQTDNGSAISQLDGAPHYYAETVRK
jgi:hypothetical protein